MTITRRTMLKGTGAALGATVSATALAAPKDNAKVLGTDEAPQVPRRVLGKTGKQIPILLVGGAVDFDPRFDPKLAEALRFGANYIDTARVYGSGRSEQAVAAYLGKAKNRDKWWITSKSPDWEPAPFARQVDTSLNTLKTSYIDLYYLHAVNTTDVFTKELAATVEKLKKDGKIRHFGFSCHHGNVAELLEVAAKTPWIEAVMFRYNFRQYGNKELNKAIDACAKANVGMIAMKTQGSAVSFEDQWKRQRAGGRWNKAQAVLKAVWADDRIAAAVSHMDTLEKLKQNISAALDKELTLRDRVELRRYELATRSEACDGCEHICNARVDAPVRIGETLRYLMYHDSYGEPDKAKALYRAMPAEARRLAGVDFRAAERACPHGVAIARHMRRAAEVLG